MDLFDTCQSKGHTPEHNFNAKHFMKQIGELKLPKTIFDPKLSFFTVEEMGKNLLLLQAPNTVLFCFEKPQTGSANVANQMHMSCTKVQTSRKVQKEAMNLNLEHQEARESKKHSRASFELAKLALGGNHSYCV